MVCRAFFVFSRLGKGMIGAAFEVAAILFLFLDFFLEPFDAFTLNEFLFVMVSALERNMDEH